MKPKQTKPNKISRSKKKKTILSTKTSTKIQIQYIRNSLENIKNIYHNNANMSKRHNKTDSVNLGDPLPLTYLPTRRPQQQQQQRQPSGSLQQSTSIEPLPPPTTKPTTSSLLSRLVNNNPSAPAPAPVPLPLPHVRIPRTSTIKDRIKNKLRQLIHELNELETYEEEQLIIIEQKLNDISNHLIRINTTNILDQEEQEEQELLNNVKTNILRLRSQNENQEYGNFQTFFYQQKYLIWGIIILIISFLISSLIVADFKYQYCYYFC